MRIRCMIVDDEPLARELIASYIHRVDDLELVAECSNAIEAFTQLQKEKFDIVFLDIQMPKMNGLELIKSLQQKPGIIISTAYREYAVDGFELDALDYLVKPVTFERFMKSIARYHQSGHNRQLSETTDTEKAFDESYMFFKVNKDLVKIFLKDILYIESIKDYIRITTSTQSIITYQRLGYIEEKLPEKKFFRIHKSFIVATGKITSYNNYEVKIETLSLPIGRNYKQAVLKELS